MSSTPVTEILFAIVGVLILVLWPQLQKPDKEE